MRTFFKCATLWGGYQNPTFIRKERVNVLRGNYGDGKSKQAYWAMGYALGQ